MTIIIITTILLIGVWAVGHWFVIDIPAYVYWLTIVSGAFALGISDGVDEQQEKEISNQIQQVSTTIDNTTESVNTIAGKLSETPDKLSIKAKRGIVLGVGIVIFFIMAVMLESAFTSAIVMWVLIGVFDIDDYLLSSDTTPQKIEGTLYSRYDPQKTTYLTEHINNRTRHRTPIYIMRDTNNKIVATLKSNPENVTKPFTIVRLVNHSTGQLYACVGSPELCYPVKDDE